MDDSAAPSLTQLANTITYGWRHGCSTRWLENRIDQLTETWLHEGEPE